MEKSYWIRYQRHGFESWCRSSIFFSTIIFIKKNPSSYLNYNGPSYLFLLHKLSQAKLKILYTCFFWISDMSLFCNLLFQTLAKPVLRRQHTIKILIKKYFCPCVGTGQLKILNTALGSLRF